MGVAWHIAQFNVATALYPPEDPRMSGFYSRLDEINRLAEESPGFVWRLQGESGDATDIRVGDDPLLIVNMSVWQSAEALFDFAYRSAHRQVLGERRHWFRRPESAYQVLWWIPAGHRPAVEEAMTRLELLRSHGPTAEAFTFKTKYPPPGIDGGPDDLQPEPYCAAWM